MKNSKDAKGAKKKRANKTVSLAQYQKVCAELVKAREQLNGAQYMGSRIRELETTAVLAEANRQNFENGFRGELLALDWYAPAKAERIAGEAALRVLNGLARDRGTLRLCQLSNCLVVDTWIDGKHKREKFVTVAQAMTCMAAAAKVGLPRRGG